MSLTFDEKEVYNLEKLTFIGGGKKSIPFEIVDENNEPLDITRSKVVWTLSRFGEMGFTLLTKECKLSSNTSCKVILDSKDTKDLEGKFIQQVTVIDSKDNEYPSARGIIKINRNNYNNI